VRYVFRIVIVVAIIIPSFPPDVMFGLLVVRGERVRVLLLLLLGRGRAPALGGGLRGGGVQSVQGLLEGGLNLRPRGAEVRGVVGARGTAGSETQGGVEEFWIWV
jgi:hypothetical protein